ncbi:MAG: hypothetical protein AB1473_02210 [Thermodesulfobacteriota bacterium]
MAARVFLLILTTLLLTPVPVWSQAELIELFCPDCGYRQRFVQGSTPEDEARNVQQVIVVCERSGEVRSVKVPLDSRRPVHGEPLVARPFGTAKSKVLGIELPKFLIPGNTCALFPVTAYLEANVCPVDGRGGVLAALVDQYNIEER